MSAPDVFTGTAEELIRHANQLIEQFGMSKVRLISHDEPGGERVWMTPCDQGSKDRYDSDNSRGETIYLRILNTPIGWGGRTLYSMVAAITQGKEVPVAYVEDQKALDEDTENILKAMQVFDDESERDDDQ